MDDVARAGDCRGRHCPVGDRALDDADPIRFLENPVVTKRAHPSPGISRIVEEPGDETAPDLAGRAGDKDQHVVFLPAPPIVGEDDPSTAWRAMTAGRRARAPAK